MVSVVPRAYSRVPGVTNPSWRGSSSGRDDLRRPTSGSLEEPGEAQTPLQWRELPELVFRVRAGWFLAIDGVFFLVVRVL